jgi:hypothetical protein
MTHLEPFANWIRRGTTLTARLRSSKMLSGITTRPTIDPAASVGSNEPPHRVEGDELTTLPPHSLRAHSSPNGVAHMHAQREHPHTDTLGPTIRDTNIKIGVIPITHLLDNTLNK